MAAVFLVCWCEPWPGACRHQRPVNNAPQHLSMPGFGLKPIACVCCAVALQVLEMRASDVDTNDWMEAFEEWQKEVLRATCVHFSVMPPEAYLAAVNSGAATGGLLFGFQFNARCKLSWGSFAARFHTCELRCIAA